MSSVSGLDQTTSSWLLGTASHLAIAAVGVPVQTRKTEDEMVEISKEPDRRHDLKQTGAQHEQS